MKRLSKRIVSILLSVLTLVSIMPLSLLEVSAEENNGLDISLSWGSSQSDTYTWDSTTEESRSIKITISYKNNGDSAKVYDAGALSISLNGIGAANRGEIRSVSDIGADKIGTSNKSHKWSYSWDDSTDVYTFVNNEQMDVGSAGSFDMVYSLTSTDTKHNYSETITAKLQDNEGSFVNSNSLYYSETRERAKYVTSYCKLLEDTYNRDFTPVSIDGKTYVYYKMELGVSTNGGCRYAKGRSVLDFSTDSDIYVFDYNKKEPLSPEKVDGGISYYSVSAGVPTYKNSIHNNPFYFLIPCDVKYDNVGNKGNKSRSFYVRYSIKGTYHEEDDMCTLLTGTSAFTVPETQDLAEVVWEDRLWVDFSSNIVGHKDQKHFGSNTTIDNVCNKNGWVNAKGIYSEGDVDATLELKNKWINGVDYVTYSSGGLGGYYRWYISDIDGKPYMDIENNGKIIIHKEANTIDDVLDIVNNDLNNYYISIRTEAGLDPNYITYTWSVANEIYNDTELVGYNIDWFIKRSDRNFWGKAVIYTPDECINHSVKELQGLSVTYDNAFVQLNNGEYRILDDSEYSLKSIIIPSLNDIKGIHSEINNLKFQIYGFDGTDYKLLDTINLEYNEQKYSLPDGISKLKISILKGDDGDYKLYTDLELKIDVDYHLNKDKNSDSLYVVEDNGIFYMSSYYSYIVGDKEFSLIDSSYFATNVYSTTPIGVAYKKLSLNDKTNSNYFDKAYDTAVYGHTVTRSATTSDNIINYISLHRNDNRVRFGTDYMILSTKDNVSNGELSLSLRFDCKDKTSPLNKFSISTLLPENCYIDSKYLDNDILLNISEIEVYDSNKYYTKADIKKYVKVTIIQDYKDTGRLYIRYDFDLSDSGILLNATSNDEYYPNSVQVVIKNLKFDRLYKTADIYSTSGAVIYDKGLTDITSSDPLDIDNNGVLSDKALYHRQCPIFRDDLEYYKQASLYVKTGLNCGFTKSNVNTFENEKYYYNLVFSTGDTNPYYGVDITLMLKDLNSDWCGTFYDIETSTITSDCLNRLPVYYTTSDSPSEEDWVSDKPNNEVITGIRLKFSKDDLSSFVMYGDVNVLLTMTSPKKDGLIGKTSKTQYTVRYLESSTSDTWSVLDSNAVSVKMVGGKGKLTLTKKDSVSDEVISGAVFDIYSNDGSIYLDTLVTDENGKLIVPNIPYGDYILREKVAPKGYILSKDDYSVSISSNTELVDLIIFNDKKNGTVELTKTSGSGYYDVNGNYVSINTGNSYNPVSLKGAVFDLYNSDDTLIKKGITTDENGKATISDLEWGSYYLKEVKAPDYYVITENALKVSFNVTKDNVDTPIYLTVKNGQKPAKVRVEAYEVDSNGNLSSTPMKDVGFSLDWTNSTTNKDGVAFEGLNFAFGDYILKCESVPYGYAKPDDVSVLLTEKNCDNPLVVKVGIKRKTGTIKFYKENDMGSLVPNAKYGLYKEDGTLISTAITNEKGYALFEGLEWGIKYYLQELEAPIGHSLNNEKYYVDVRADNVWNDVVVSVKDDTLKGDVTLIKTDYTTGDVVSGAIYNVYKSDDTLVLEGLKTGSDGKLVAEGLNWGTYYFKEVTAPSGYCLSDEKIYFSVNYETILNEQVVTAEDIKKADNTIRISKEISISDLNYAQGNPTFLYKVTGVTDENKEVGYSASIIFDKDSVDSYLNANPDSDVVVLTANIPVAEKGLYTVTEQSVIRYADNKVNDIINGTDLGNSRVSFDIKGSVNFGEVTFSSSKVINSGLSANAHSSSIISVAELPDRPMNKLVATYGEETLSTETIDKDKLVVYMQYTDGTKKALSNDDYTLSKETFDLSKYSDNTVYVTYTEDGKTYKTSFNIIVAGSSEFSYHELDDGTIAIDGYLGSDTSVYFPSTINGKKVSSIVSNSLDDYGDPKGISGLENVTEIVISDGIEYIGDNAFYMVHTSGNYSEPMSVTLGKGLKRIGDYAFYENRMNFNDIYLTDCEYIGQYAFAYGPQNFKSITIKGSNIQISQYAFAYIRTSGDLVIEGQNVVIDSYAFYYMNEYAVGDSYNNNKDLKSITIKGVSSIGSNAFYSAGCFNITIEGNGEDSVIERYAFYDLCYYLDHACNNTELNELFKSNNYSLCINNIGTIKQYAFDYAGNYLGDVKIQGNNTTMEGYAFEHIGERNNGSVEMSLSLTGSFKKIDYYAFYNSGFVNVDLSGVSSNTVLEYSIFSSSRKLSKVTGASGITSYPDYCFADCNSLQTVEGFREDAIIGDSAFTDTPFEQTLRDKGLIE